VTSAGFYALLPIVRNTHAGILGVSAGLRQAAMALGLRPRTILALVVHGLFEGLERLVTDRPGRVP
jgi:ABC-type proline/glycine betaine transport system permease subunit